MILHSLHYAFWWMAFTVVLKPLILRNLRLREQGLLPDEWYWADLAALKRGFTVSPPNQ